MHENSIPELPNVISVLADKFHSPFFQKINAWQNIVFSLLVVAILSILAYLATRKIKLIPDRLQNTAELLIGGIDDFICGILGPQGRKYTPFIGTLFIYIIAMNLLGLFPFLKPPTSSWSITLALAICVFLYVQYTAIKELGVLGYVDHLAGKPRGALAFTIIMPLMMFILHVLTELIRPLSLSLRLRSNIWGDEVLLAVLAGFGIKGLPLLFINMAMSFLTSIVQAVVFCLLSTIYFALVLNHEEKHIQKEATNGL